MPTVKETITRVQHALASMGFSPGNIDGVWGRRTEAAVKAFQASRGLVADGVVGPLTSAALFGTPPKQQPLADLGLVWFLEARRLLGVKEAAGSKDNRVIIDWASDLGISYKHDDIPWCGLFVAHCIGATLSGESLPGNPLGARNWLRFGAPCSPRAGAVMVFWREKISSFKGHVGFYAGEDPEAFHILGGNQSDQVSVARVARSRLLGARWPASVALPEDSGTVKVGKTERLSTDEE
jgi:uncharacterized protein (TIGR02594 family)